MGPYGAHMGPYWAPRLMDFPESVFWGERKKAPAATREGREKLGFSRSVFFGEKKRLRQLGRVGKSLDLLDSWLAGPERAQLRHSSAAAPAGLTLGDPGN